LQSKQLQLVSWSEFLRKAQPTSPLIELETPILHQLARQGGLFFLALFYLKKEFLTSEFSRLGNELVYGILTSGATLPGGRSGTDHKIGIELPTDFVIACCTKDRLDLT
jgi:hypothetical protein